MGMGRRISLPRFVTLERSEVEKVHLGALGALERGHSRICKERRNVGCGAHIGEMGMCKMKR